MTAPTVQSPQPGSAHHAADDAMAVRAMDLWKTYGGPRPFTALRGLDLEVPPAQILSLVGRSGSGKTTLLNLLAGLDRASRGELWLWGRKLSAMTEAQRVRYRRMDLGFVFQFFHLLPTLTVTENVRLAQELIGRPDPHRCREVLASVGLDAMGERYPSELSGGEQQRVAIARVLVKRPKLILADEPTGNLDSRTGGEVMDLLIGKARELSATLIFTTHSHRLADLAERTLQIEDGAIRPETNPAP